MAKKLVKKQPGGTAMTAQEKAAQARANAQKKLDEQRAINEARKKAAKEKAAENAAKRKPSQVSPPTPTPTPTPTPRMNPELWALTQEEVDRFTKTNAQGKTKDISEKKYNRISNRYKKQKGSTTEGNTITSGRNPQKSVSNKKDIVTKTWKIGPMKTGGSVKKLIKKKK